MDSLVTYTLHDLVSKSYMGHHMYIDGRLVGWRALRDGTHPFTETRAFYLEKKEPANAVSDNYYLKTAVTQLTIGYETTGAES